MTDPAASNDADDGLEIREAVAAWAHGIAAEAGGKVTAEQALEALLDAFRRGSGCGPGDAPTEDPGRPRSATASGCGSAGDSICAAPTFDTKD